MTQLRHVKRVTSIDADVLTGIVTFTDGMRLEITFGSPPQPDAKFYVDGNPLGLETGDEVILALARRGEQ